MKRLRMPRVGFDGFTLALFGAVGLASFLPATGAATAVVDVLVRIAVTLLFFLHGARLSRDTVLHGLTNWRLQLLVLACSFVLFPMLGLAIRPLTEAISAPALGVGMLFLCCLPSTVQSSIAFTSIARGNVSAAVCAASASNLLGIALTPLLTGLLLSRHGEMTWSAVGSVASLLLLPFIAGQWLQPKIGRWVHARSKWLALVDRGSILLMVYSAFSHSVTGGLWSRLSMLDLAALIGLCVLLLAVVLVATHVLARAAGLPVEDQAVVVFCGSKKSLVTGVPMANVLFAPAVAGTIVLPLMVFHQLQLIACALIAARYARRAG